MSSGFKYHLSRINEIDARYERHYDIPHLHSCNCECSACTFYPDQCCGALLLFFRDRKREHYDDLNDNVFVWMKQLKLEYVESESDVLTKIIVSIPKDSMFYDDARRHMSRKMKKNLDNFEKSVKSCNEYIDQINPKIKERIKAIVFEPIHGHISDEDVMAESFSILNYGKAEKRRQRSTNILGQSPAT